MIYRKRKNMKKGIHPEYKDVGTDYDAVLPQDNGYSCPIYLD